MIIMYGHHRYCDPACQSYFFCKQKIKYNLIKYDISEMANVDTNNDIFDTLFTLYGKLYRNIE